MYVFVAEECPISIYMARPLREAVDRMGEGVAFYAVFPSSNSTEESADEFLSSYDLKDFRILLDTDQQFTRKVGATVTPEVVILDREDEILYRGRISNAYSKPGRMRHGKRINDLVTMLRRIKAGEVIDPPWLPAVGCFITFRNTSG